MAQHDEPKDASLPIPDDAPSVPTTPSAFQLVLVEEMNVPEGGGQKWYRYVLDNGSSKITGQRCGGLKEVTAYAKSYAEQLNARGIAGHSAWSPHAKKKPG